MATNEETLYMDSTQEDIQKNVNGVSQPETEDETRKKQGSNTKARAAAVAVGVMAGGGVAYAIDGMGDDSETEVASTPAADTMMVTTEDDSLSFEEAFNDARSQLGPGGVFRWHGGVYNTYTESEWNSMSDAEKAEFGAKVEPLTSGTERLGSTYTQNASHHTDNNVHHRVENHERVEQTNTKVVVTREDNFNIEFEENGVIQGQEVIIGHGTHNGHNMVVVDVNRDGKYDLIVEDTDNDGSISDNELVDITDKSIGVGNKELLAQNTPTNNPGATHAGGPVVEVGIEQTDVLNGKEVVVGAGTYDDHMAIFVDINKDGSYDTAIVDKNDNEQFDRGEGVDIRGEGIYVNDKTLLEQNAMAQNDPSLTDTNLDDPNQGLPDYAPDYI